MKDRQHPATFRAVNAIFPDNQMHKHTARMKVVFILDHIFNSVAEWRGWLWWGGGVRAACVFPGCLGCMGYVSLLLLGFSEDRFPLSSVEEFNHAIWKSHDATVRAFMWICEKSLRCWRWWRRRARMLELVQPQRAGGLIQDHCQSLLVWSQLIWPVLRNGQWVH